MAIIHMRQNVSTCLMNGIIFKYHYNKGRVKIKCNDTLDEFDVVMDEAGWSDNDISTTYWGTMNTFKGYIRDIIVGAAPKRLQKIF